MAATPFFNPSTFDPKKTYIRLPEVCAIVFRKTSWVYSQIAEGKFPAPVKLSPAVSVWAVEDVQQWLIDSVNQNGSGVAEGGTK